MVQPVHGPSPDTVKLSPWLKESMKVRPFVCVLPGNTQVSTTPFLNREYLLLEANMLDKSTVVLIS